MSRQSELVIHRTTKDCRFLLAFISSINMCSHHLTRPSKKEGAEITWSLYARYARQFKFSRRPGLRRLSLTPLHQTERTRRGNIFVKYWNWHIGTEPVIIKKKSTLIYIPITLTPPHARSKNTFINYPLRSAIV